MSIDVTYRCGGCFAEATVRGIRQEVTQISPLIARKRTPTIASAAPEGWVAFDPYTGCTYCADCWASIENPQEDE